MIVEFELRVSFLYALNLNIGNMLCPVAERTCNYRTSVGLGKSMSPSLSKIGFGAYIIKRKISAQNL